MRAGCTRAAISRSTSTSPSTSRATAHAPWLSLSAPRRWPRRPRIRVAARARRRLRPPRGRRMPIAARRRADRIGGDPSARCSRAVGSVPDSFEQALTIVYRMLFLLFAEARALVPLWHPIYRESYSLEGLRDAAERSPHAAGLWDALRAIARLAHAGCRAGDLQVTPFNGRLFAPGANAARRAARPGRWGGAAGDRGAVDASRRRRARTRADRVSRSRRRAARRRLRDAARLRTARRARPRVAAARAPACARQPARSTRRSRSPTISSAARSRRWFAARSPDRILQLRVVDPAMGSGAFLVAACRFLAEAYETALIESGGCHRDRRRRARSRRDPANDRGAVPVRRRPQSDGSAAGAPLAVAGDARRRSAAQFSRPSAAGRRQPARRVARPVCATRRSTAHASHRLHRRCRCSRDEAVAGALREALPVRFSLEDAPNDTIEQVRAKERALAGLGGRDAALSRWKRVAHLWCAAWFADRQDAAPASAFGSLSDTALTGARRAAAADCRALPGRGRCNRRRRGACFTGSSSFPRCSSIATAAACRTPASTR